MVKTSCYIQTQQFTSVCTIFCAFTYMGILLCLFVLINVMWWKKRCLCFMVCFFVWVPILRYAYQIIGIKCNSVTKSL